MINFVATVRLYAKKGDGMARKSSPKATKKTSQRKAKILHLQDILLEMTDDEHGLTMPQLIEQLQLRGVTAERKAIYDDLETLEAYGLDIIKGRGAGARYAIGNRQFELPELLLLADAVQSSRFLTQKKSTALISKLEKLTSVHHNKLLDKTMHVEGRIKMQNESIYYNIDTIQEAIRHKSKITFRYFYYGFDKREVLRREGKHYLESPIELVYKDEYYYLISYNDKYNDFVRYRVDRMLNISETAEPIPSIEAIKNFDVQKFVSSAFGMFGGEEVSAVLVFSQALMGPIIDRFGKDVPIYKVDEETARIHVHILKSNVFFGWLAQFGSDIIIEGPQTLALEYKEYLQGIVGVYEEVG